MSEAQLEHRKTDDPTVTVRLDNRIRVEWLIGGLLVALIASFAWAFNSSMAQRDTSRDMTQIKSDISDIKANGNRQLEQSNQTAMKNVELAGRLSALEGRMNTVEAVRQPQPKGAP